jgi:hypothetical protein
MVVTFDLIAIGNATRDNRKKNLSTLAIWLEVLFERFFK